MKEETKKDEEKKKIIQAKIRALQIQSLKHI